MSAEKEPAESLIGTVLDGSYRIEGLIGEGGMGAVYEATHLRLDKRVAVKVMVRELAANAEALTRFHREAVVTSGLGHPHIVQVLDFSTTQTGEPFFVMEFLRGEDLERRLSRNGRLPAAQVVSIVRQVASALAATHAKGIVHRDLKPANIYLLEVEGETDFVKVVDFGISKVRSATTKLTRTSTVIGTPNYMSPEQAKGKTEEIDERTDQWALACIAWECLSGEGPFVGENVPSILFQIVHEPPPTLFPKVAGLPPQVEDVLVRALAKDKNDRFASVSDFANAFAAAVAGASKTPHESPVRTMQLPPPAAARPARTTALPTTFSHTAGEIDEGRSHPSRRNRLWFFAAAAVVALTSGALLLLRPGASGKPVSGSSPPVRTLPSAPPPSLPDPVALPKMAERPVAPAPPAASQPEPGEALARTLQEPEGKDAIRASSFKGRRSKAVPSLPSAKKQEAPQLIAPELGSSKPTSKEDRWRVD